MFTSHSLRGRILNRALHHQHAHIYNFDRTTVYGSFSGPCTDLTLKFLDLVHYDRGGRIFTYILSLDGLWRFTETGKEFGIDLLSKHTMHSDVSIYIAYSGEFFVRRLKNPRKAPDEQPTHPPDEIDGDAPKSEPPKDPAYYQLVIDNDSGTYRPNKDLLPQLKDFLHRSLPDLKISTLDCMGDKEKMDRMKSEQRERRKAEGENRAYLQGDSSSISSSDEEDLDALAGEPKKRGRLGRIAHNIAEPKDTVLGWAQRDRSRGKVRGGDSADAAASASRAARQGEAVGYDEKGSLEPDSSTIGRSHETTTAPAMVSADQRRELGWLETREVGAVAGAS